jgi:hypothetical protein
MEKEVIKKIVIGTALGFLLGFGSAWIYLDKTTGDVAGDTSANEKGNEVVDRIDTPKEELNISSKLMISEQSPGDKVVVDKAQLDKESWVVIYEDNNGELGKILGARLFPAGLTEMREVFLLRSTTSTLRYYALIHSESGDGDFDYKDDIALTDAGGERLVITSFTVK